MLEKRYHNHFGFSIHKQIICFDKLNQEYFNWNPSIINKLGDNVGWCKEEVLLDYSSQYIFNLHTPLSYLPTFWAVDSFIYPETCGGFFIIAYNVDIALLSKI